MRTALLLLAGAPIMLGACHGSAPAVRATSAEDDIAMVERVQHAPAPIERITLEPVSFADGDVAGRGITTPGRPAARPRAGDGCTFYAATAPRRAVLVATPQLGLVRHDGELETFASDSGSTRVSGNLPVRYLSGKHTLQLADAKTGADTLTINDKYGRVVYASAGDLDCKP